MTAPGAQETLWWLLAHDPETGAATRLVGVAGVSSCDLWVSWLAHTELGAWHDLLGPGTSPATAAQLLADRTGRGVGVSCLAVDEVPTGPDLAGRVEAVVDAVLATPDPEGV